jgi:hypothetical protein
MLKNQVTLKHYSQRKEGGIMSSSKENLEITEFGIQLDHLIARLDRSMTYVEYSDLAGISYKYISQLRNKPDRRPGSYAIVKLLKPFVDFKLLSIEEALHFSKITRGKMLSFDECQVLFPNVNEEGLRQAMNAVFQSEDHTVAEQPNTMIIDNDFLPPKPVIEFLKQGKTQFVKMIENSATCGRHYIDSIKTWDSRIKQIQLLIHNPLEQQISEVQKNRTCEQIRTLKLVDFKNDVLKIKCYNHCPSIRGRKFDNELIVLGWYTYYYDPNFPEYGDRQIWGHTNPLIVAHLKGEGKYLGEMFDKAFEPLWNSKENTSLFDICTKQCKIYRAGSKSAGVNMGCTVSEDWLKRVSD